MPKTAVIQTELLASGIPQRIAEIVDRLGGQKKAHEATGISLSQIRRYKEAISEPTASSLISLAVAGGVTANWILTGKDSESDARFELNQSGVKYSVSSRQRDVDAIVTIVSLLERLVSEQKATISTEKKAKTIAAVFDLYRISGEVIDEEALARMVAALASDN